MVILSKKRFNELVYNLIVKTAKQCGRNLSIKDMEKLKERIIQKKCLKK